MTSITRRRALRAGTVTLGALVGGCTAFDWDSPEPTRPNEIGVWNFDPVPRTVRVLLVDDGDPIYWGSEEVDGYADDDDTLGYTEFEDHPTAPGTYVLYAWRDDQPRSDWNRFDFGEFGARCTNIRVKIGDTVADTRGEVSIVPSAGCSDEDAGS